MGKADVTRWTDVNVFVDHGAHLGKHCAEADGCGTMALDADPREKRPAQILATQPWNPGQ